MKRKKNERIRIKEIAKLDSELARLITEELSKPKDQEYQGTVTPSYPPTNIGEQYAPTTHAGLLTHE